MLVSCPQLTPWFGARDMVLASNTTWVNLFYHCNDNKQSKSKKCRKCGERIEREVSSPYLQWIGAGNAAIEFNNKPWWYMDCVHAGKEKGYNIDIPHWWYISPSEGTQPDNFNPVRRMLSTYTTSFSPTAIRVYLGWKQN